MTALEVYTFPPTGHTVRSFTYEGVPWFVGRDVATGLKFANPREAVRMHVPAGHKGGSDSLPLSELGLDPQTIVITEAGMYRLIMRANTEAAEEFQEWVTAEVLPSIRKTGSYEVALPEDPLDALDVQTERTKAAIAIARQERAARIEAETRAEVAETFKRSIEGGDGLSVRAFVKKYFSDVSEARFNRHLYDRCYLIDQTGTGPYDPVTGRKANGPQHRHPKAPKGKEFFYLHNEGFHGDRGRWEQVRVRPGGPELALRDRLAREGLPPNEQPGLFGVEGDAA